MRGEYVVSVTERPVPLRRTAKSLGRYLIPIGVPVSLGMVLALLTALLITRGRWVFALPLTSLVPAAILFNTYPFIGILLWFLISPYFQTTPTAIGRYFFWMVHRAMMPVALVLSVVTIWIHRRERRFPRLTPAELAMFLYMALAVLSILLNPFNFTGRLYHLYDRVWIPFLAYLLIRYAQPQRRDFGRFLPILIVTLLVESVVGLMSWFVPSALPPEWLGLQGARTTGTLANPAVYTNTLIFSMVFLIHYAIHGHSAMARQGLLLLFGLGVVMIMLSFSRGSWLGCTLVLLGLLVLYPRVMLRLLLGTSVIMVILGSGLLSSQMAFASERLEDRHTTDARIVEAYAALRMLAARPLLGWGYDSFDRYDRQFVRRVAGIAVRKDDTSHNTYLTILAEMGGMGFILYVFPLLWWLYQSIRHFSRLPRGEPWGRRFLLVLWLAVLHYRVTTSFMDMRFFPFGSTLFWMELGFIGRQVARTWERRQDQRATPVLPAYR